MVVHEDAVLFNSNKNEVNQQKSSRDSAKESKGSGRKKLLSLEPEYNEVCWEYNQEELDREIANYHKHETAT